MKFALAAAALLGTALADVDPIVIKVCIDWIFAD
jgi:hypothetical protein